MQHNRVVWCDIPVSDLDRATSFYSQLLDIPVTKESFQEIHFSVLSHDEGNGGCLIPRPEEIVSDSGILVYLNTNGRIRSAVSVAKENGGKILEDVHSIGPHGFRAILLDSEGNRIAVHSDSDS